MTVLVTGGTGKTGLALAKLLHQAKVPVLIASRTRKAPEPFKSVKFDWFDPTTYTNPFNTDHNIDKLYIIAPRVFDPICHVKPFVDLAVAKGVKHFISLTSTRSNPRDHIHLGQIHKYLLDIGVNYTILRPTWFMENFSTCFYDSVRDKREIFSCTGDGCIPFVAVQDIAQAAFEAFTAKKSPNKDLFLVGPGLYSYDKAAKLLASVLGREITHKQNNVKEQTQLFGYMLTPNYTTHLAKLECSCKEGKEEKYFCEPEDRKFVGKYTLLQFFQDNKALWTN